MANILSNIGITSGSIVETTHVTQLIDAFTGVEAYDITLSGSLTITGSLTLSDPITLDFYGTSSTSDSSSYAPYSLNSTHAITTSFADNETMVIQFTHQQTDIETDKNYFIGTGTILSSTTIDFTPGTYIGYTFPFSSGTIISSSISATVFGDAKNILYDPFLVINNSVAFIPISNQSLVYNTKTQFQNQTLNYNITQGDKLNLYLQFAGGAGDPATGVIHNVTLYIKLD
jgi:hypothetical protein